MALTSKDIALGSGSLYIAEATLDASGYPTIPTDATIETEANRLGHIKEGCTLSYQPTFYTAKDDLGKVSKTIITEESVTLNAGVITWVADTLKKLSGTGAVTTDTDGKVTLKVGGAGNYNPDLHYILRFVHIDGKHRITIMGNNTEGFELGYKKDAETSIGAAFTALPLDSAGHLFIYEDTTAVTPGP